MSCSPSAWAKPLLGNGSARDPGFMDPTVSIVVNTIWYRQRLRLSFELSKKEYIDMHPVLCSQVGLRKKILGSEEHLPNERVPADCSGTQG